MSACYPYPDSDPGRSPSRSAPFYRGPVPDRWQSPVRSLEMRSKDNGPKPARLKAYGHPGCHRTSNPVDRLLRRLDHHLYCGQHLHGSEEAAERGLRGWSLIQNFAPSCPEVIRESPGLRSPAERFNGKRYHPEWLQNLLVSALLGGYRSLPRNA